MLPIARCGICETRMVNAMLTFLNGIGHEEVESFGDITGKLALKSFGASN